MYISQGIVMFRRTKEFKRLGQIPSKTYIYEYTPTSSKDTPIERIELDISTSPHWDNLVFVYNPDHPLKNTEFEKALESFLSKGNLYKKQAHPRFAQNAQCYLYRVGQSYGEYTELDVWKKIILMLCNHNVIDEETKNCLFQDIDYPVCQSEVYVQILQTAKNNVIEAKRIALERQDHYQDAVWILAEHMSSIKFDQEARELYSAIPVNNPHYKEAQEKIGNIIQNSIITKQKNNILSQDEYKQGCEQRLIHSINAGNIEESTRLFFELSGDNASNAHPEIKPDAATLLALSRHVAALNNKIAGLENEILKKKIATAYSNQTMFNTSNQETTQKFKPY
jgi:hypothetical protein